VLSPCRHTLVRYGMPVPYPRSFRGGRTNRGFTDLRGLPSRAAEIVEARESPMLRELLIAAAHPEARLFTIGCDLGGHNEPHRKRPEVAGGYIQFALRAYAEASCDLYEIEAKRFEELLRARSRGHWWKAAFEIRDDCVFRLGSDPEVSAPALTVYFWARGIERASALLSREALLAAIKANLG
jgi:hypothetical protein